MKIRNIDLGRYPIFLAPMEDVTDPAFRLMCKKFGADMVYTEFVSADALIRSVGKTMQKLNINDEERPVAVQIYGRDTETMVEAAKIVEEAHPDILDINFGCPVKRVAGKGAGAGMLQNIPLMLEITRAVVDTVKIPVTVKTRLGWDNEHKIIVDLAEQLQDCGIEALTIHGRTRAQMYTGEADWSLIGEVKKNPRMHIPIIGNGDITTPQRAKECFDLYGVDAIMIGRASFGRPWIFKEIKHYLETGEELTRDDFIKAELALQDAKLEAGIDLEKEKSPGLIGKYHDWKKNRVRHKVNKKKYLLLCLFLGWCGGHRYYEKRYVLAAFYTLFFWSVVPFFLCVTDLLIALPMQADENGDILI